MLCEICSLCFWYADLLRLCGASCMLSIPLPQIHVLVKTFSRDNFFGLASLCQLGIWLPFRPLEEILCYHFAQPELRSRPLQLSLCLRMLAILDSIPCVPSLPHVAKPISGCRLSSGIRLESMMTCDKDSGHCMRGTGTQFSAFCDLISSK